MSMPEQLSGWGYYRWSSDRQNENDSKERQLKAINELVRGHNINLLGIFGDEAVSAKDGKNLEREFAKLLKVLKPGQCIVAEDMDRVSRQDSIDTLHFLKHDVIRKHDATIVTKDGVFNKDNFGNLGTKVTAFLKSELAHQENRKRIERVNSFFTNAVADIKRGIPVAIGARLPSWIRVNEHGKWAFHEDKKKIVQRVFREYLRGVGMRHIALALNKEKTPPLRLKTRYKKKTVWSVSTVTSLLRSNCVRGTLNFRDESIPNAFPAIISEKDFRDVQVKLQHNKDRHGKVSADYRVSNLFRGLTKCVHCGATVIVENTSGNKKRDAVPTKDGRIRKKQKSYRYFACHNARYGKCKATKRLNIFKVEKAFFVDCLCAAPSDLLTEDNKEALALVASVEERLSNVENNIAKYLKLMESGMDFGKVQHRLSELRDEKNRLAVELAEAKNRASTVSHLPAVVKDFNTLLNEDLSSEETRRKIVELMPYLVKEIVFDLNSDPTWHPDFTVTFVNGAEWTWSSSADEIIYDPKQYFGKGKLVMVRSFHTPVDGVWGNILPER